MGTRSQSWPGVAAQEMGVGASQSLVQRQRYVNQGESFCLRRGCARGAICEKQDPGCNNFFLRGQNSNRLENRNAQGSFSLDGGLVAQMQYGQRAHSWNRNDALELRPGRHTPAGAPKNSSVGTITSKWACSSAAKSRDYRIVFSRSVIVGGTANI